MRRTFLLLLVAALGLSAQNLPSNYHLKLVTPVDTRRSKVGDSVRAAVISPESLLNGYLVGQVTAVVNGRGAQLELRFDRLLYQGKSIPVQTVVTSWVNSKGHEKVDDEEQPLTLQAGRFTSPARRIWLDEGAELRAKVVGDAK